MTIYKYIIPVRDNKIEMSIPSFAEFLHVGIQPNKDSHLGVDVCLWAKVEPKAKYAVYKFKVFGTGHPMGDGAHLKHLGTVILCDGALVLHVFLEQGF